VDVVGWIRSDGEGPKKRQVPSLGSMEMGELEHFQWMIDDRTMSSLITSYLFPLLARKSIRKHMNTIANCLRMAVSGC
jgi:hypothetical protein